MGASNSSVCEPVACCYCSVVQEHDRTFEFGTDISTMESGRGVLVLTYGPCTVSGGFAIVQPDSVLSINAVEGFPLEDLSADVSR